MASYDVLTVGSKPTNLPRRWHRVPLRAVAQLELGSTVRRPETHSEPGRGLPWLTLADARHHPGRSITETELRLQVPLPARGLSILPERAVCMSRVQSPGLAVILGRPMAISTNFVGWICSPALQPGWLAYALLAKAPTWSEHPEQLQRMRPRVHLDELKELHIHLPPVDEQRRVVAQLDGLRGRSARAYEHLEAAHSRLGDLRRALFAAALPGTQAVSRGALPTLAEGWRWVRLGDIAEILSGRSGSPRNAERIVSQPAIQTQNLGVDHLELDALAQMPWDESELQKYRLHPNDILLTSIASASGGIRCAMVDTEASGLSFRGSLHRVRLAPHQALPRYIQLVCMAWSELGVFATRVRGSTIPHLSLRALRELPIPLCPLPTQAELAESLDAKLEHIVRQARHLGHTHGLRSQLDRGLLTKAMRGALVETDPADEPIDATLARLKQTPTHVPERPRTLTDLLRDLGGQISPNEFLAAYRGQTEDARLDLVDDFYDELEAGLLSREILEHDGQFELGA